MLNQITPIILTYNEAANVRRTLEQLHWASDIVVVDSFSDDETLQILAEFPQVRLFQRQFDDFATQSNFALHETGIKTEWVLSMDADYVVTSDVASEIDKLKTDGIDGFNTTFVYCVYGKRLRSGIYPPRTTLFRRTKARFVNDGHAHRVVIDGNVQQLRDPILHDDRKSLQRWFQAQVGYTQLEAQKLLRADRSALTVPDRIRRLRVVAPPAMLFYCLVLRGGLLDGWPGLFYAFQRTLAELMLSLQLIDYDLRQKNSRVARRWVETEAAKNELPLDEHA